MEKVAVIQVQAYDLDVKAGEAKVRANKFYFIKCAMGDNGMAKVKEQLVKEQEVEKYYKFDCRYAGAMHVPENFVDHCDPPLCRGVAAYFIPPIDVIKVLSEPLK
ncbi:hypothetical protein H8L32_15135 [Undibacterium sp. CY18W]|uniref:Uncharacterized protein n=1 Tax=Undibacterium hunanense TaxID=2762292 RepID=A0ABR6ZSG9_9BURK|nr:hypothetical protein [Undibacterium hunanense]MBC3918826.1 hypothetical protein [Undibacterium hunanense]